MDKTTEILIEAKRLLEEELEWYQGGSFLKDESDRVIGACALGAIALAAQNLNTISELFGEQHNAADRLSTALTTAQLATALPFVFDLSDPRPTIVHFNDNPNTSKEDVPLAFKRAIHGDM